MTYLENVKGGDTVALRYGTFNSRYTLVKVKRTTKTQIVIENDQKFRRNGRLVGGDAWSSTTIHEPTDEIRETILDDKRHRSSLAIINPSCWARMSTGRLEAIAQVIKDTEPKE